MRSSAWGRCDKCVAGIAALIDNFIEPDFYDWATAFSGSFLHGVKKLIGDDQPSIAHSLSASAPIGSTIIASPIARGEATRRQLGRSRSGRHIDDNHFIILDRHLL
jgi:hypothetical protein